MENDKIYRMGDVLKVTGLPRPKLDTWMFKGIVKPVEAPGGSGYPAGFSYENILSIVLIDRLARSGIALKNASEIASRAVALQKITDDKPSYHLIVVNIECPENSRSYWTPDIPIRAEWPLALQVDVQYFAERVLAKLEAL